MASLGLTPTTTSADKALSPILKTAVKLPNSRNTTREDCFSTPPVRYSHVIATRLQAIKRATPLTTDAGVMGPKPL